ncbi:hypothetical protein FRB96_009030 [Tulasnella sp. 330]|nr:hypothetical protein FRB96_009030 [Tulasnella sp. 330]
MPATLIPAPSFITVTEDPDFDADFDLPDGDAIIGTHVPAQSTGGLEPDEDWDADPQSSGSSPNVRLTRFGTVTNMTLKLPISKPRVATTPDPEDWDDDEDFDLPPQSSRPLRLSLSPRTKIRMETLAREAAAKPSPALNLEVSDDVPEDEGNASTIKISRLAFNQALTMTANPAPITPPKLVPLPPSPTPPNDDDFEDDFSIPDTLERLSLKTLPTLTHRLSKTSTDPWGDNTSSTLVSDASSSTLSHPSPYHSSQPSTEDDSDGFGDGGDFDGLVLPETLSPVDMQRILEGKKKGLLGGVPGRVKVARPSDGEDDFESGLVIGADDDLSPSRLKKPAFTSRAVGKGTLRSYSAPTQLASHPTPSSTNPAQPSRPPSAHSEQAPSLNQLPSSRGTVRSPTLLVPGTTMPAVRPPQQEPARTLRRTPSAVISGSSSSRPGSSRWQTFSSTIRHSPSLANIGPRPSSPTKIPLPVASMPPPTQPPRSPIPSSSQNTVNRPPTSAGVGLSGGDRSFMKHQKSFSRLPSMVAPPVVRKMSRKASLSSLVDMHSASSQVSSPSPSPEVPFAPSVGNAAGPRPLRRGLSHAVSFRDLGGGTLGPSISTSGASSSTGIPRFAYEAPTAAYNARRATSRSGTIGDDTTSGSDREKERRSLAPASSSSRTLARARGAISNIFPAAGPSPTNFSGPLPSPLARSPSPVYPATLSRLAPPSQRPSSSSTQVPTSPPPARPIRRPKKVRVFGDGTELDGIEDLTVERDKESKFRVAPSGRGNVGTRPKTSGAVLDGAGSSTTATIGRRSGSVATAKGPTSAITTSTRPDSSTSSRGDPPRFPSSTRRAPRIEFQRADTGLTTSTTLVARKRNQPSAKRKPVLIRNLSGTGSPKVVNGMKWNPITLRWEGNDAALRDFELNSSTRPALITHLTASSVAGLASPPGAFRSLANGARVVGDMMFDPLKMCWVSRTGEEEDPFAEIDDATTAAEDDEDWDADGKGGTIRAIIPSHGAASKREGTMSGVSSSESSPARSLTSRRGSSQHARSASESDSESIASVPGPASSGIGGGRESSLGSVAAMTMINEDDDNVTFPVARELVAACNAADDRHRAEMRGWQVSSLMGSTASSRRRLSVGRSNQSSPVGSPSSSRVVTVSAEEEPSRLYLYDIRALAQRAS